MSRLREWICTGRPSLGAALLLVSAASIAMLLYEGSRAPAAAGLPSFRGADKVLHFGAHFWVSALMFWGLVFQRIPAALRPRILSSAVIVLAIDITAGIAVEGIQASLGASHGRVFDWKDVAANVLGAGAAVTISLLAALRLARTPVIATDLR